MLQSNTKFYLKGNISQALTVGGTFNISNDLELGLPVDTGGETVSIVFKNARQIERMTVTISQSVCTVVKRGIEQQGGNANAGLQKQWSEGVLGYITALDFDIVDKDGDSNTVSADMNFSGDSSFKKVTFNSTVDGGLEVNSLTTTEREALTPVNGTIVYDETLGDFYMYKSGAWASIDTGTATPNMSETVNGTGEIATASQRATAQSIGETGARLVVSNDGLVKVPDVTPANDENKVPVLNASGKLDDFVSKLDTYTEEVDIFTGDKFAFTRAGDNSIVDYSVLLKNTIDNSNYIAGTTNLYAEANTERTSSSDTLTKVKEITIVNEGDFTVSFDLKASNNAGGGGRAIIYVNDVSVGTLRNNSSETYITYTEDIRVSFNDKLQLYYASNSGAADTDAVIRNFNVKYDLGVATPVINQD